MLAPILSLSVSLMAWIVVPISFSTVVLDIDLGLLWILMCSSLGVYGIILAGWASNSKFAFLGAIRSVSQMVSYEVTLSIILLQVIIMAQSTNLSEIVHQQESVWFILPLLPFGVMWTISTIAETNRPPFDLPEAEAELVAGYFVDYSSMGFAVYQIAEYANIILMSALTSILFLGGWLPIVNLKPFYYLPGVIWMLIKMIVILFIFLWIRVSFPRYRYDQLMQLTWRVFLPITLAGLIATSLIVYSFS
jgi:NADH-quinone oxidoreductase subunit H